MKSTLTKSQKATRTFTSDRREVVLKLRYDDQCSNGHNTFSMTYDKYRVTTQGRKIWESGGASDKTIAKYFPAYAQYLKWHLTSSDGPLHYIANSVYHASKISKHQDKWFFYLEDTLIEIVNGEKKDRMIALYGLAGGTVRFEEYYYTMEKEPDLDAARSSAVWPDAELEDFTKDKLNARLPALMEEFQAAMEELGFTY